MQYIEVDSDLSEIVARKLLKVIKVGRGSRGGYYTVNEHHKKRYYKPKDMKKVIEKVAKRSPKEIAAAVLGGLKGWKRTSKKQRKVIGAIGGSFLDDMNPQDLDKFDKAVKSLTPAQQVAVKNSGAGQLVLANSKNQTPAIKPGNSISNQTIDTDAKDVTDSPDKTNTPSTGLLRGAANLLMRAAMIGLFACSWALGTDDFTVEDIDHSKSYVNTIHDQAVNSIHKTKKFLNTFTHKKPFDETSPEHWATSEDKSYFNIEDKDDFEDDDFESKPNKKSKRA